MYVYLVAGTTESYDVSAYSYMVGNLHVQTNRHVGWTVVEAYLYGFLDLNNYVIKNRIIPTAISFDVCTPSGQIKKIVDTPWLETLQANSWVDPDGPLFYKPLLQELYFHRIYFKERGIQWSCLTELNESEFRSFTKCKDVLQSLLRSSG